MHRRRLLTAAATVALTGLAGCTSSENAISETSTPQTTTTTSTAQTTTAAPPTSTRQPTTTAPTTTPTTAPQITEKSVEDYKEEAKQVSYDELFRNWETYVEDASPVHFPYGYVYQAIYDAYDDGVHHYQLEVSTSEEEWQGDIALMWDGQRLLEEDFVELWGFASDLYEYETVQGDQRTIPRLIGFDVRLRDSDT